MLIFASFAWVISLGFRCTPAFQAGYGVAVAFICGFLVLAIPFLSRGASDALDRWDQAQPAFIFAVAFTVVPVMHLTAKRRRRLRRRAGPVILGFTRGCGHGRGIRGRSGISNMQVSRVALATQAASTTGSTRTYQIWHIMFVVAASLILYAGLRNATVRATHMPCVSPTS